MRKRDIALELAMERVAVFYYVIYYIIGEHLNLLPSLKEIGEGDFTKFYVIMMAVYMVVVVLSHWITCVGVEFFTKEKDIE